MRLLTYNIRHGGAGREAPLAAVIRGCAPDIVILQEATRPEVVDHVARACGMLAWGSRRGRSLGFMSRVPLAGHSWHQPRGSRHAFLEIVPQDAALRIFGVHLSAVHAAWTERRRVRELRSLIGSIREESAAQSSGDPHRSRPARPLTILAGDFNTLAPGELLKVGDLPLRLRPFIWLSGGEIRWRTIREVIDAGFADGFRSLHPTEPGLTFPTWRPHVRLDYVFVPATEVARLTRCEVVTSDPASVASDHFPLLADVSGQFPPKLSRPVTPL